MFVYTVFIVVANFFHAAGINVQGRIDSTNGNSTAGLGKNCEAKKMAKVKFM